MKKKNLTFWQRLKIAKKHRVAAQKILKTHGVTFLKELCGVTNKKPELSKFDNFIGYIHYEAGLTLHQISNDLALTERNARLYNQNLLDKLGVRTTTPEPISHTEDAPV